MLKHLLYVLIQFCIDGVVIKHCSMKCHFSIYNGKKIFSLKDSVAKKISILNFTALFTFN